MLALAFSIVTLALSGASPALGSPSAAPKPLPASFFGVNAGTLFDAPQSEWGTQLAEMQQGGIAVVRTDAPWSVAEPMPPVAGVHHYDFSQFDAIMAALAAHHLRWLPIIDYSAPWAASEPGNDFSAPASDADYAAYARALAQRYGAGGSFWAAHPELPYLPVEQWEIWNEENSGYFWQPSPDPAGYVGLYLAARAALRSVDPSAQAVVGGLADVGNVNSFLRAMFLDRPDALQDVDAIALHPYPLDPTHTAASAMQQILSTRQYLNSLGGSSIPIMVTEVGWTTEGSGAVSGVLRAQQLSGLVTDLAGAHAGVIALMPYAWVTRERYTQAGDWYGLFNASGTPTVGGTAYLRAIKLARAPQSRGKMPRRGGRHKNDSHSSRRATARRHKHRK